MIARPPLPLAYYLALKNASKKWTMPIQNWPLALNQFEILCGDFRQDLLEHKF